MTLRVGTGRPDAYSLADGSTPLSASQVAKHLGDPESLTRWAVEMSRSGKDPFRHRDEAADIGTAVHAAILAHLQGLPYETILWDSRDQHAAERAFAAWLRWWAAEDRGEPIAAEVPMVSERMRLAGTLDLLVRRACGLWLYSWKGCGARSELTGKWKRTVYRDQHVIQEALYGRLWLDSPDACIHPRLGLREAVAGATLVYIPRDDGDVVAVDVEGDDWQQAQDDAEAFVRIVWRHLDREKRYAAMARPCPTLEPVDMDAPIDFGP